MGDQGITHFVTTNWYALNGQEGVLCDYGESPYSAFNLNAYLNNIFMLKKHKLIAGLGGQKLLEKNEIMCMIGYEYVLFRRISVNATIYQWIWKETYTEDTYTHKGYRFSYS